MLAKFVDTVCTTIAKVSLYVCGCVSGALNFCAPLIQPHFVFNFNLHRKSTARLGPIFYRYHAVRKYVYVSPPRILHISLLHNPSFIVLFYPSLNYQIIFYIQSIYFAKN